jgi:hypothetical protein
MAVYLIASFPLIDMAITELCQVTLKQAVWNVKTACLLPKAPCEDLHQQMALKMLI